MFKVHHTENATLCLTLIDNHIMFSSIRIDMNYWTFLYTIQYAKWQLLKKKKYIKKKEIPPPYLVFFRHQPETQLFFF